MSNIQIEIRNKRLVLENNIKKCRTCSLRNFEINETNLVGGGNCINPEYFFIGIAPSQLREKGKVLRVNDEGSGRKFRNILEEIGMDKKSYFTNVIKCSIEGNKDPNKEQLKSCLKYLLYEIDLFQPKFIITLGRIVSNLFGVSIGSLRRTNLELDMGNLKLKKDDFLDLDLERYFYVGGISHFSYVFSYSGMTVENYKEQIKILIKVMKENNENVSRKIRS